MGQLKRLLASAEASLILLQGLVKLADFGVAAKLAEMEDGGAALRSSVVGTPYWMAPEAWKLSCSVLMLQAAAAFVMALSQEHIYSCSGCRHTGHNHLPYQ